jgi:hypothetical protein
MEIFIDMTLDQKIQQLTKRLINTMQQAVLCIAEVGGPMVLGR